MRRNPVKKGKLTYGESYEINKRRKEEEARKREQELHASYTVTDDSFDTSLGAMMGAIMASDSAPIPEPVCDTSSNYCDNSSFSDSSICDSSSSCDISSSFD